MLNPNDGFTYSFDRLMSSYVDAMTTTPFSSFAANLDIGGGSGFSGGGGFSGGDSGGGGGSSW